LFTVLMICHNRLEDLRKSLTAVAMHQTYPLEVILVDNNSREPVERAYREFSHQLSLTMILRHQLSSSLAFASARNIGLRMARNPWIVSLDPDCVINPDYFSAIRREIEEHAGDRKLLLVGERKFINSRDTSCEQILTDPRHLHSLRQIGSNSNYGLVRDKRMPYMAGLPHVEHAWDFMHGCNLVYHVDLARDCGGHDESFDGNFGYEDIEFAYRMISEMHCVPRYIREMTVFHLEPDGYDWQPDRSRRKTNNNWKEVCRRIPGYHEYKLRQYRSLDITPRDFD
jgi:GT2 family glycosyltransferase